MRVEEGLGLAVVFLGVGEALTATLREVDGEGLTEGVKPGVAEGEGILEASVATTFRGF